MKYEEFKKILERAEIPDDAEIIFLDDDIGAVYEFVSQSNDLPITEAIIHVRLAE